MISYWTGVNAVWANFELHQQSLSGSAKLNSKKKELKQKLHNQNVYNWINSDYSSFFVQLLKTVWIPKIQIFYAENFAHKSNKTKAGHVNKHWIQFIRLLDWMGWVCPRECAIKQKRSHSIIRILSNKLFMNDFDDNN